jgi:hypothetical protein
MPTLTGLPEVLTPQETAAVLRTTVNSLAQNRYLKRGLPYIRSGRKILYTREDVLAYLAAGRKVPDDLKKVTA